MEIPVFRVRIPGDGRLLEAGLAGLCDAQLKLVTDLCSWRAQTGLGDPDPAEKVECVTHHHRGPRRFRLADRLACASDARRTFHEGRRCGDLPDALVREEELEVAARLAHVHLHLLAIDEELSEIAEKEAPAPAALVEVALAGEGQRRIAAHAVEGLVGDSRV
jgi:hypothetical protein